MICVYKVDDGQYEEPGLDQGDPGCGYYKRGGNKVHTGGPTKHDSWWKVLDVFFPNLLSCLIQKRIIKYYMAVIS